MTLAFLQAFDQDVRNPSDVHVLSLVVVRISGLRRSVRSSMTFRGARQLIECDSYNSVVALLAGTDMVAILSRRLLTEPYDCEHLQEIKVREGLPSYSVGLFSRAGTPLTPAASAMAKAITAIARQWDKIE